MKKIVSAGAQHRTETLTTYRIVEEDSVSNLNASFLCNLEWDDYAISTGLPREHHVTFANALSTMRERPASVFMTP